MRMLTNLLLIQPGFFYIWTRTKVNLC